MNRLWVRLSIYFSGFVLLSMLLLVVGSRLLVDDRVRQSLVPTQLRAPGGIIEILTDYYREHGSWDGVDGVMAGAQATFRPWSGGMDLGITDTEGEAIYALRSRRPGGGAGGGADGGAANGSLGPRRVLVQLPINVDGTTVGFLEARPMMLLARELGGPDPIAAVSRYLLLIAWSLPAALIAVVLGQVAEAVDRPWPVLGFMGAAVAFNAGLNWLLIFGHWGCPALGLEGAGWATLTARWLHAAALVIWICLDRGMRPFWRGRSRWWRARRRSMGR